MLIAARALRGIVSMVIGVDTIDIATAGKLGLVVAHGAMPENYIGVAEATVMFVAALSLALPKKEALIRSGAPLPEYMIGHMVQGQTIGLLGLGRVGHAVVERLSGWAVSILAVDPAVAPGSDPRVEMVDLPELLHRSDFVSIHTTLTDDSRHLLGPAEFALMKPGSYLINTARGSVIDEPSLIEALRARRLAGAALDVFEDEPLALDNPLRAVDNVILTPHMIGHSEELLESIGSVGAENVRRVLRGETPLYVKNPDVLPAWTARLRAL
jgi:D-3-phosphoglycerate dehydrogenase